MLRVQMTDEIRSIIDVTDLKGLVGDIESDSMSDLKEYLMKLRFLDLNSDEFEYLMKSRSITVTLLEDDKMDNRMSHLEFFFEMT